MPLLDDLPRVLSYAQVQTGVPFGEVSFVRDWLEIRGEVGRPRKEHAKRPVDGFNCKRSEVGVRAVIFFWFCPAFLCGPLPRKPQPANAENVLQRSLDARRMYQAQQRVSRLCWGGDGPVFELF